MPNEAIRKFPGIHLAESSELPIIGKPDEKRSWLARVGVATGVIMTVSPPVKTWTWNPAVITLVILVVSIISGGSYYLGHQAAQLQQMQQQIEAVAADEKRRKELEIYNSRQTDEGDGHAIKDAKTAPKK